MTSDIHQSEPRRTFEGTEEPVLPKVSILTPVYNEGKYVAEMIESVLAQTFQNWELLIVDDGSTDNTWQIVKEFSAKDSRVRPVGTPGKRGKVAAFNEAYSESEGSIIVLLGGDDRLTPSSLETRASRLLDRQLESSVAYFRLRTFSNDRKFDGMVVPKRGAGNRSGGTLAMSRKLAAQVFPIPEELVAEDIWISQVNEILADSITEDAAIVLEYRIHGGNSNPRHLGFRDMSESIHRRSLPYEIILNSQRFSLLPQQKEVLEDKVTLENLRYQGKWMDIVFLSRSPLKERLRALAASNPFLYSLRSRFYKLFSGWG